MEYRQLGSSGLRVSKLCLGTMLGFTDDSLEEATQIVDEALDNGLNFIDTADMYARRQSEEVLGRILSENNRRERAVLATKFGWFMGRETNDYGAGAKHMIKACEESLKRLQTDYIDLYILHVVDPNTPMQELLYTFDTLVRQGKVRYAGTSKHSISRILEGVFASEKYGFPRFASEQSPYNLLDRTAENELIPACRKWGIGITPFVPLAEGLLTGKYNRGSTPQEGSRFSRREPGQGPFFTQAAIEAAEKLAPIAESKGITLAEMSLAWVMEQPGVTSAILGARKLEYLRSGLKACDVTFTPEELQAIDEIVPPGRALSGFYESIVYKQLRHDYHASIFRQKGTGAFIPRTETAKDMALRRPGHGQKHEEKKSES